MPGTAFFASSQNSFADTTTSSCFSLKVVPRLETHNSNVAAILDSYSDVLVRVSEPATPSSSPLCTTHTQSLSFTARQREARWSNVCECCSCPPPFLFPCFLFVARRSTATKIRTRSTLTLRARSSPSTSQLKTTFFLLQKNTRRLIELLPPFLAPLV